VYAQLDTSHGALGDTEQLHAVTEFLGIADILAFEFGDAFRVRLVELRRDTEADGG